ncbi:hypothetical protein ONE63_001233 [Megalurothrips usitatus]|uniref:Uncharacterized protein n=1 Tax=Megalurothrips usitatus TaxID=439358 RepID=A0AAV7XBG6_9NEOP|nr:hypothetical protein ONE63_001233 [Megalurothrips usitatus]
MFYLWIRKQVRKFTKPIPVKVAEKYDSALSIIYVLSAWSALGLVLFRFLNKRKDMKEEEVFSTKAAGMFYGRMFQASNMHIVDVSNRGVFKEGVYHVAEDTPMVTSEDEFYGEESPKSGPTHD